MSSTDIVLAVLWIGVTAYAVLGGADFGAGLWDLIAGDAESGRRPRELIDRAITPVWEANHTWLIFDLVVLWTAFSEAFAAVMSTLFVPLTLAALGIVLRGSGFAFRHVTKRLEAQRLFGAAFALSCGGDAVLHGDGRRRRRLGTGDADDWRRRGVVELDRGGAAARGRAVRGDLRLPLRGLPRAGGAPRRRRRTRELLPPAGDRGERGGRRAPR